MWKQTIGNAVQFPYQELQVDGKVPKGIKGRYFKNGPGLHTIGDDVLDHWFLGDAVIFMLECKDDKCWGKLKFVETPIREERQEKQKLSTNFLTKFNEKLMGTANTSVLPLKNSQKLLALVQSGLPFVLNKKDLQSVGFDDFGWIKGGYSAHPKVDPVNGDIYNFGTNFKDETVTLSHSTKDMKLVKSHTIKLREFQSIHDFCLAGDYIIIFECSINFSIWNIMFSPSILHAFVFDEDLPKLVHIFKKSDFSHVRTVKTPASYVFHFANGFSTQNKVVVQYCNYHPKEAKQLFALLEHLPNYANGSDKQFCTISHLEQMEINLETGEATITDLEGLSQFPVCEDHEVGKQWRYTYTALHNYTPEESYFNKIGKYDRVEKKWVVNDLGEGKHIGEPAIIRVGQKVYLLALVNEKRTSYVYFFDGDSLETLCTIKLPGFAPSGFHGKWDIEL